MAGPNKRRFDEIFQKGRRISDGLFRVRVLPGTGLVGIATAKKIGGKPRRNFVKRRMRALLALGEPWPTDLDGVIVVGPEVGHLPFEDLRTAWSGIRAKITREGYLAPNSENDHG